jgi:hypothetical protein
MRIDPATLGELLEQRAVEAACDAVVDILDGGLMAQLCITQAGMQAPVTSVAGLPVEEQSEPFGMAQGGGFTGCFDLAEGLGHAVEAELIEQVEGRMGEQGSVSYW